MAYTLKDRVLVTSTSVGLGDFILGAPQTGYQSFSVVGNASQIPYTIQGLNADGTQTGEWEVGIGTWYSAGNYITRDTVLESSNSDNKVNFSGGSKDVFLDLPGELVVQGPDSATASDFVAFDGTSGKIIKDSGYSSASFATAAQGAKADTAVQQSVVGQPNGVASLDSSGKVPTSQIPQMGDLNYQGTWNAATNTPTLTSGTGTKGYYYVVNVAGTTNLDGITDWQIGDWAVFNGSIWQKIDNTDAVTSVNGYTGAVVLTYSDVGAANAGVNTNITSMTGITGGISTADYVTFDTTYSTALTTGQLGWDGNNTLGLGMAGGNVVQHIGEDSFFYCKASSAITKGQVVMFTGAVGASAVVTGAPATGVTDGTYIMGIAAENIALNGFGLVQNFGTLRNVNTTGYADGDILWYNPAVTGGLTKTAPSAPNVKVQMAAVLNGGSAGGGSILIRVNSGSALGGTDSNVQITTPSNGQILTYDGTNSYWKNTSVTAGTAISVTPSATGVLTIANTAPDQVVSITGAGGAVVTGTYPTFTITTPTGTVTSVTATAPLASSGGATPNLTITKATTLVDGYLAAADFTTFNNKQNAYTNLTTIGSLANGAGWLYNNGSGTFSYSTPTAAQVGAVPTTRTLTINGTAYDLSADRTWSVGTVTSVSVVSANGLAGTVATATTTPAITLSTTVTGILKGNGTAISAATSGTDYAPATSGSSILYGNGAGGFSNVTVGTGLSFAGGTLSATATGVTSIAGTANQITASASTGAVTLSVPSTFIAPGSVQSTTGLISGAGIVENSATISANYTITTGNNAMSAGPITINSGITVTVPTGSNWVII